MKGKQVRTKTEKYFKRQFSTIMMIGGVPLTLVGLVMTLASRRTQYMGMTLLILGAALWIVATIIRVKGDDVDKRIDSYVEEMKKNFYEGINYVTKKVVLPVPFLTNGYIYDEGKYMFRRGSDGKIRTECCFVTGVVDEKDQIIVRYEERSVIDDKSIMDRVFFEKYSDIISIEVCEQAQTPLSKNYVTYKLTGPSGGFTFVLAADAQADKMLEDIGEKIASAHK